MLSPLDWALIENWQARSIPLHVVLRAIESVFDVFDRSPSVRTIKSLMYCREEVEAQFAEWSDRQVGRSSGEAAVDDTELTRERIERHIRDAVETLKTLPNENFREDLSRATARLEELLENLTDDHEAVDGSLGDIEKMLDRSLLANTDTDVLKELKKAAANELRAYKADMEKKAYDETMELMILKRLRDENGVPRLGLFYL